MDPVLAWAQSKQNELVAFLRELVECESPSDDAASVDRCATLFADHIADVAKVKKIPGTGGFGPHLQCDFSGRKTKDGQILVLGHSDTVYPMGTLETMPFRITDDGRIHGPGIFDMKGGLAMVVFAMRALKDLGLPVQRKVLLQVVSDEEMGSHSSRGLTEEEARRSQFVIVAEPAAGPSGKAKTSRKGVGGYRLRVHGRAAHAGLDFAGGASAILELAKQIQAIATFTNLDRGLTISPGIIAGGTRTNVVAAEAACDFDVRVARAKDWDTLDRKMRKLKADDKRCTLELSGELNRPPLERTKGVAALYKQARMIATTLGVDLGETGVGGGSDGNFTGALGIPTLDGMGAVGDGAHTPGEYILADRIPDRVALLAKLIQSL